MNTTANQIIENALSDYRHFDYVATETELREMEQRAIELSHMGEYDETDVCQRSWVCLGHSMGFYETGE